MYRWRKFVRPKWLDEHEEAVRSCAGNALAIIERPHRKCVLIEAADDTGRQAKALAREFGGSVKRLRVGWLNDIVERQKRSPIKIGKRLLISDGASPRGRRRPQRQGDSKILIIPTASAFGTGEHATTTMCLRLLEQVSRPWSSNWTMLDAGTGSGILALAARIFGAGYVIAIDHDPHAIRVAKQNAQMNQIKRIKFKIADAAEYKTPRKFDVITANLFSEVLIKVIPRWKARIVILSGILRHQERSVARALRKEKIAIEDIRRRGRWVALLCRKDIKEGPPLMARRSCAKAAERPEFRRPGVRRSLRIKAKKRVERTTPAS